MIGLFDVAGLKAMFPFAKFAAVGCDDDCEAALPVGVAVVVAVDAVAVVFIVIIEPIVLLLFLARGGLH